MKLFLLTVVVFVAWVIHSALATNHIFQFQKRFHLIKCSLLLALEKNLIINQLNYIIEVILLLILNSLLTFPKHSGCIQRQVWQQEKVLLYLIQNFLLKNLKHIIKYYLVTLTTTLVMLLIFMFMDIARNHRYYCKMMVKCSSPLLIQVFIPDKKLKFKIYQELVQNTKFKFLSSMVKNFIQNLAKVA